MEGKWDSHYNKSQEKKLSPAVTLTKALQLFDSEEAFTKQAIDLGCGSGIDSIALLTNGWKVIAVDSQPQAFDYIKKNIHSTDKKNIEFIINSFDRMDLPATTLLNASFSLPFCGPQHFKSLWSRIENAILSKGRFAGHFFGPQDSWVSSKDMTFHSEKQVVSLFDLFRIEYFLEVNKEGTTIKGTPKHWHVFHVVAQKR